MLNVTYFFREPRKTGFSMEGIFTLVKSCLAGKVAITDYYCVPGVSRYKNAVLAGKHAGAINHITGDVNFILLTMGGQLNILTIHDLGFYENTVHSPLVRFVYGLFWYRLPLRKTALVTVVSEFTKNKLIHYFRYPAARIRVIPDPVKPLFRFAERQSHNEEPRILMMGSGKHKNLNGLIEAANGLDVRLDIIGFPSAEEQGKMNQYGIAFTVSNGLTDEEVYEHYRDCDLLYAASFYEGFGMPIIEAQAVGRPVITSDLGAMKEVGQGSAVLVDPADPIAIRDAIMKLISDRDFYYQTVNAGRANAEKYEANKIAEMYYEVYQSLASKNTTS